MKYIKMLGLLAVVAAALMVVAGTALATTLTSPTGTLYTGTLEFQGGHLVRHNASLGVSTTCTESRIVGKSESHGASVTASGKVSLLTFNNCGSSHTTTKLAGSIEMHSDGSLASTGAEITVQNTTVGISCTYTTSNTPFGTLTDSHDTGGHAVLEIQSAIIPRTGHSAFCGTRSEWTGRYTVTTPAVLYLD